MNNLLQTLDYFMHSNHINNKFVAEVCKSKEYGQEREERHIKLCPTSWASISESRETYYPAIVEKTKDNMRQLLYSFVWLSWL